MILQGDCMSVMQAIKPNSIDAVVTDPPYGLEFMGKEWDRLEKIPKGYIECRSDNSIIKKKMPKTKKKVQRPYGGYYCSKCMRKVLVEKVRG